MSARPFIKWAGGKTALLSELLKRVPPNYGTYHEPFLGGGALFFALQPKRAILCDVNARLIRTYAAVKYNVDNLVTMLKSYKEQHSEDFYYATRFNMHTPIELFSLALVGAQFIYLNKTSFNGLWRENRAGKFNVPCGKYKNPAILDEENLRACSQALQAAEGLGTGDFRQTSIEPQPGDLWYADPPYVSVSDTSNFTGYSSGGFTMKDQTDLRDLALSLKRRGVHVMLSNSGSPVVEKLYAKDFKIEAVKCRRNINSKGDKRGEITEYIIT